MTREDHVKEGVKLISEWTGRYMPGPVSQIVNKCFNDFKSRTCGSCKFYKEISDYPNHCGYHDTYNLMFTKDFGCNKFKLKESR